MTANSGNWCSGRNLPILSHFAHQQRERVTAPAPIAASTEVAFLSGWRKVREMYLSGDNLITVLMRWEGHLSNGISVNKPECLGDPSIAAS